MLCISFFRTDSSLCIYNWLVTEAKASLTRRCLIGFSPLAKSFLLLGISIFQFFITKVMKFMTLSDIYYFFRHSINQVGEVISNVFLQSVYARTTFFATFWFPWSCSDQYILGHIFLLLCLFRYYGISTFLSYLIPNPFFLINEQFNFKQFYLA